MSGTGHELASGGGMLQKVKERQNTLDLPDLIGRAGNVPTVEIFSSVSSWIKRVGGV